MSAATYAAIVADVYSLTARPDLVAETAIAVRKATMKFHLAETFKNDISIAIVTLPVLSSNGDVSFRYTLDLTNTATYPFYRKVAYIKEYNAIPTGQEIQFKEKDITSLLDNYQLEDINYWTQQSMQVSLRCNKVLTQLAVGYYRYPDVTPITYTSWIADQYQDAITEEACAAVFKAIGKDSEYQRLAANFVDNLHLLQMTQI